MAGAVCKLNRINQTIKSPVGLTKVVRFPPVPQMLAMAVSQLLDNFGFYCLCLVIRQLRKDLNDDVAFCTIPQSKHVPYGAKIIALAAVPLPIIFALSDIDNVLRKLLQLGALRLAYERMSM